MPNLRSFCLSIIIVCCAFFSVAKAQHKDNPLQENYISSDSAKQLYQSSINKDLAYINGREYKPYHHPRHDNPYLHSQIGTGTIYYNGKAYSKKMIMYDMYKDKLVVNPNVSLFSNVYIEVKKADVDSFTIKFEKFKYTLSKIQLNKNIASSNDGYYEILYRSNTLELLKKHRAIYQEKESIPTYVYKTRHYLKSGNKIHDISSKKKFLNLFPEQKKPLKKHIKSINAPFKKFSKSDFIALIKYAETL